MLSIYEEVVVGLMAIAGTAKNIHYNFGEPWHTFADRIYNDGWYEEQDTIKEVCILGKGNEVSDSATYYSAASEMTRPIDPMNIAPSLVAMKELLSSVNDTITTINKSGLTSQGEMNLFGGIAQDIQQLIGLVDLNIKKLGE